MKFKRFIPVIVSLMLVLSACDAVDISSPSSTSAPVSGEESSAPEISINDESEPVPADTQREFIMSASNVWMPVETYSDWYYAITDLDNNGRLEIIVASMQGTGLYTYADYYEVNEECNGLNHLPNPLDEGGSGPDLMEYSFESYYDAASDTIYYSVNDILRNGPAEHCVTTDAFSLKNGVVSIQPIATEYESYINDTCTVSWRNGSGDSISQEEYEKAISDFFAGMESKGTLHIEWTPIGSEQDSSVSGAVTVYASDLENGYGFYSQQCSQTGLYRFTPVNSEGITWKVYILDSLFDDAERFIPQAYRAALEGNGSVEIYEGQWIYIYSPCNSWTMEKAPEGCAMTYEQVPDATVSGTPVSYLIANDAQPGTQPAAAQSSGNIKITKNPSGECLAIGGHTWFIAHADNADALTWCVNSPDGAVISLDEAMTGHPGLKLEALDGDTIAVSNVPASFNGWGISARFSNASGTAMTDTALIYVGDYLSAYSKVLDYYRALSTGGSGDGYGFDITQDLEMKDLGYKLKDFDGDSSPELVIAQCNSSTGSWEWDRIIYSVWTLKNGSPVNVLSSIARDRNYYSSLGFYNVGSGGAGYTYHAIFTCSAGSKVFSQGVVYDNTGASPWFTLKGENECGASISEEQFNSNVSTYESSVIPLGQLTPIN